MRRAASLLLTLPAVAFILSVQSARPPAAAGTTITKFELVARARDVVVDDGIVFRAMTFNGRVPGPLLLAGEGDTVQISVRNADTVAHGASIHAANAQTSRFVGNIQPGESRTLRFTADVPGVFMYHCAPGGQGIMTHTMGGMYGMLIVEPRAKKYRLEDTLGRAPDLRLYILQHELYANGRDFVDGRPLYVMFNGYNFRYVREPIPVRPGDYVRLYYLNVGPNLTATFHVVGGIWENLYYGGHPNNLIVGTQSAIAGPTDSWVIEWRVPGEGPFTLVTHAFGTQTLKGAIGILDSRPAAPRVGAVRSEGRNLPLPAQPKRVVSPFGIGSPDLDRPVRFRPGDAAVIQMVANSFWPKVAEVPLGTTVTWVNEDVFDLLDGERTGVHNVVVTQGPQRVSSPMLGHAQRFSARLTRRGTYEYLCAVHPYMRAVVRVY